MRRARELVRPALMHGRHRGMGVADVGLASYPRSGSNWLSLMLGELLVGEDVDFLTSPVPWIGDFRHAPRLLDGGGRLIKTHESCRTEYVRAVHLVRHPAAVARSYHRAAIDLGLPALSSAAFTRAWLAADLNGVGTWQEHVLGWLDGPVETHLVRYEDLVNDPLSELDAIMRFVGRPCPAAAIQAAVRHNSFESMKAKRARLRPSKPNAPGIDDRHLEEIVAAARPAMARVGY